MELIFLRHGLAVDKEEWKGEDEARPLTAEGVERTKEVVRGLRALKVCPDVILSSPLLRARETAEIAKKGLSSDAKVELADELTPRSEEHTSELQSLAYLVCRLLLEKKKKKIIDNVKYEAVCHIEQ